MVGKIRFYVFVVLAPLFVVVMVLLNLLDLKTPEASQPLQLPPQTSAKAETPFISSKPNKIMIPSVGIDLSIEPGNFSLDKQTWTLSSNKAHFAEITALPNNKQGNTFIYGHNNKKVFGKLKNLKAGEEARVYTESGKIFTYKLVQHQSVPPTDLSLFEYKGPSMLTLQTCGGLWNERRDLAWFEFVGVS